MCDGKNRTNAFTVHSIGWPGDSGQVTGSSHPYRPRERKEMFMLFPLEFLSLVKHKKNRRKENWGNNLDGVSVGAQVLCLQKLHIHARVNDLSLQLSLALEKDGHIFDLKSNIEKTNK